MYIEVNTLKNLYLITKLIIMSQMITNKISKNQYVDTIFDTNGSTIPLHSIVCEYNHTVVYVSDEIPDMMYKNIPLKPIFDKFGGDIVIKAMLIPNTNSAILSIFPKESCGFEQKGYEEVLITHNYYETLLKADHKCVDVVIGMCVSDPNKLKVVALKAVWENLTLMSKIFRVLIVVMLIAVVSYWSFCKIMHRHNFLSLHEIGMIIFMLFKEMFIQL